MADDAAGRETLRELVRTIRVAMLTTIDENGSLTSRPILALLREGDDAIWFMSQAEREKLAEISADPRVNLAFIGPKSDFLSVSGRASISQDRDALAALWHPSYRAWFPDGQDDDRLVLVRVDVDRADFWDAPASRVVRLFGMAKAMITGQPHETAVRERLISEDDR